MIIILLIALALAVTIGAVLWLAERASNTLDEYDPYA